MPIPAGAETLVGPSGLVSTPMKLRSMKRKLEDTAKEPNKSSRYATRATTRATTVEEVDHAIDPRKGNSSNISINEGRVMLQKEVRAEQGQSSWRCQAVTKDWKSPNRIRIVCRDEAEHKMVKRLVGAKLARGARVLRDELYPIKVDNVNRIAVLDEAGNIRTGAAEAFGKENDTQIAKIVWLSKRDIPKAYGSMVLQMGKPRER